MSTIAVRYLDAIANHGRTVATHIGLVNELGNEITGGSPAYARRAVTWLTSANGVIHPNADLDFNVPAGTTVAGIRFFSALTGGTNFGGRNMTQNEVFTAQGIFRLLATASGIRHTAIN